MALEKGRNLFKKISEPLVSKLEGVNPATLTWLTLPTGLAAAWLMMEAGTGQDGAIMFLGAAFLMASAMALDGLDGNLARATGRVTRWGDYLDHTLDRVLDVVWILALGYNLVWFGHIELAWMAAMLTMFGSYMGTQAQAVAGSRNYRGFSRADRTILSVVAIFLTGIFIHAGVGDFGNYPGVLDHIPINPLSLVVLISAFGGLWTFLVRFQQAKSEIMRIDIEDPLPQPNQSDSEE